MSLQFTGVTSRPSYIAYTGGALTGYAYNSGTGTLSLTASSVDPAASASDPAGSTLGSAFGLIIETDTTSSDYQGTVFRTDGFWADLAGLNTGYAGTEPLAGVNFDGEAGQNVNFDAHLTVDYLSAIGINSPSQCMAYLQKAGTSEDQALAVTRELFGYGGIDPSLTGGGYSFGGDSTFDFDGDGSTDNYLIANYSNSSWSEGNVGVVPEPASAGLVSGFLTLTFLLTRRRRRIG